MSSSVPPKSEASQGGRYARPAVSSDELLPPVEPPSAGFIIQLFVIPMVIVAAVVLIWFVIESLARRGEQDPELIVKGLRSNNQARFQRAKELADMLNQPARYPEIRNNEVLADKLAVYLDELVEAGNPTDASVTMRIFLARSLGCFQIDDGLSALLNAALHDPERDVRREAINAISVYIGGMVSAEPPRTIEGDELLDALATLADDEDELIRSQTAFALGVLARSPEADPRVEETLERLVDDPYTDARFNAAIGLAMAGSPAAPAALVKNLDPESIEASVSGEKQMTPDVTEAALAATKAFKRKMLISNALVAAGRLAAAKSLPAESFPPLEAALHKLQAELPKMELAATPAGQSKALDKLIKELERTLKQVQARAAGK